MGKKRPRTESTKLESELTSSQRSDSTADLIVDILQSSNGTMITKKSLKRLLKTKDSTVDKKTIKKALKRLIKSGNAECVENEGEKCYRLATESESESESSSTSNESSGSEEEEEASEFSVSAAAVPIAMRLRGEDVVNDEDNGKMKKKKKTVKFQDDDEEEENLDDEIARLERELAVADNSSESESEDDQDASGNEEDDGDVPKQPAILSLSKFSDDHVEQLPAAALPEPGRYDMDGKKTKKRKLETDTNNNAPKPPSGLEQAVKEVLQGYQARSSEKLPFYCRFCAKQYSSEKEFLEHRRLSEFHKTAVEAERKATYCKLCRLQLTSPVQMKEHLKSKPHRERLH
ncbi:MAG: hypothetical protein SGILL_007551, partial [Bacillariaceae sp.]